jgi:2-iminobutanoate/2-iminopropanoate deaminase
MKYWLGVTALVLFPSLASAAGSDRVYLTSPLAAQHHLPFSSGVLVGNTLYIAGTTATEPGRPNTLTPAQEARAVMDRVRHVVEQAGMSMNDIVLVQVFCTDLRNYDAFNLVYRTYFREHYPARAFIGVASLLFGARYEVMGIAIRQGT